MLPHLNAVGTEETTHEAVGPQVEYSLSPASINEPPHRNMPVHDQLLWKEQTGWAGKQVKATANAQSFHSLTWDKNTASITWLCSGQQEEKHT